ncbi:alpha/beta fold hydrolase [Micromonospora sp. WMMD1128]|uniref:alpha/beta hydrolase family protein n=1 Tax=Micromonospora sp. WMMD1128 TaxID=3015150 RepID=UPI00248C8A45|nr:alpha/beta fold hydrolase [Micromonospora sp. WMMD1128]WBB71848.1 alpha/beta fold hydrolase [Micromonospora sp. WMMD1128]
MIPLARRAAIGAVLVGSIAAGVLPAGAAQARPLTPATDREVTFTVDGTVTYGTLHLPVHRRGQRMPAVLLLPGSGSTDRNGDQPPALTPHTLAKLADALARDGVASLRFDKYGSGRTGLGAYADKPETIDYPAFVRQADAAYRLLARQPEVDRRAVRLIGHSEGALTALMVAVAAEPRTAGVGLLQPLAERFLDVLARQLHEQLAAAVAAGQMSPEEQRAIGRAVDRAVADLRAHRPIDTSAMPAALAALFQGLGGPSRRYVESIDAVDPASVARRLPPRTPALLTCGTIDPQVPCDTTTPLATALARAHTAGPGRVVLPGVGHDLTDPADPDVLAPAALDALHRFMRCGAPAAR